MLPALSPTKLRPTQIHEQKCSRRNFVSTNSFAKILPLELRSAPSHEQKNSRLNFVSTNSFAKILPLVVFLLMYWAAPYVVAHTKGTSRLLVKSRFRRRRGVPFLVETVAFVFKILTIYYNLRQTLLIFVRYNAVIREREARISRFNKA